MKKYYIILASILCVELAIFSSELGAKINSLSGTIKHLTILLFLIPASILVFLMCKDKNINTKVKIILAAVDLLFIFAFFSTMFV